MFSTCQYNSFYKYGLYTKVITWSSIFHRVIMLEICNKNIRIKKYIVGWICFSLLINVVFHWCCAGKRFSASVLLYTSFEDPPNRNIINHFAAFNSIHVEVWNLMIYKRYFSNPTRSLRDIYIYIYLETIIMILLVLHKVRLINCSKSDHHQYQHLYE